MMVLNYSVGSTIPTVEFSDNCRSLYVVNGQSILDGVPVATTKVYTQLEMLEHWLATGIPASLIGYSNLPHLPIDSNGCVSLDSHYAFQFSVNAKYGQDSLLNVDFSTGVFAHGNLSKSKDVWLSMISDVNKEGLGKVSHPNLFAAIIKTI